MREDTEEQLEVFRTQIVLRQVQALQGPFVLSALQGDGQVLQTKGVVEKLLEREILELLLILHLQLDDLGLVQVLVPDEVLGQVDVRHARVVLQKLRQDEEVLRVQVLLPKIQLDEVVQLHGEEGHGAAIDSEGFHIVLVDELPEVFKRKLIQFGAAEVHRLGCRTHLQRFFLRQNRMAQDASKHRWCRKDVLSQGHQVLSQLRQ